MTNTVKNRNSRTIVKLDDKLIEIKKGKRGLVATELKDDALFDASILEDGIDKLIQNDMNQLANEAYEELRQGFKRTLKANVLRIAGFEDRWGNGYEIDHCNGRSSMMTDYLSSRVRNLITQEIDASFTKEELMSVVPDIKKALLKEAKDLFRHELRDSMRDQVRESAKEFLQNVVMKQIAKNQKQLMKEAGAKFFGSDSTDDDVESE